MASFKRKGEMTKVHFEMIAGVLAQYRRAHGGGPYDARAMGEAMAAALARTNPEFNRAKFLMQAEAGERAATPADVRG